jgi:hypothetical protein
LQSELNRQSNIDIRLKQVCRCCHIAPICWSKVLQFTVFISSAITVHQNMLLSK